MIEESSARVGSARRGAARGTRRHTRWWLLAKNDSSRVEFLTTCHDGDDRETLAVFGHEEEAEMFLSLGDAGDGWRARESKAGELVSVLHGPCARVGRVALDPLPQMLDEKTVGLVNLDRERFLDLVLGRGGSPRRHGTTRAASPPRRDRDLHETKKTGLGANMSRAEREKHGDGSRPVDARAADARPRN